VAAAGTVDVDIVTNGILAWVHDIFAAVLLRVHVLDHHSF
jgi:hypothetical protein